MNIQKILVTTCVVFFILNTTIAQTANKRQLTLQAGIGLVPTYFMDNSKTLVPPLSLTINYKINPVLSIGAFGAHSSSRSANSILQDGSVYNLQNDSWIGGLRVAAHSTTFDNFDIYGGFSVAYQLPDVQTNVVNPGEQRIPDTRVPDNKVLYAGFIGTSAYLTENFGLFGEVGYGISLLTVGLTARL